MLKLFGIVARKLKVVCWKTCESAWLVMGTMKGTNMREPESEDGVRTGYPNICRQQQSFLGLQSPR